ncbi:MAG: polyprenyl diphosphate synthase, partial [Rhodospirillaceae bacterium]|nr:polyprenyl diphosphate synthase [Rhodospirillaceae bacterium]
MVAPARTSMAVARVPYHLAVIMDGNGRWAERRGLPRRAGHRHGIEPVRAVVESCAELGVRYLTLFAFSSENWYRPEDEIHGLMSLFLEALDREVAELDEQNVRLR